MFFGIAHNFGFLYICVRIFISIAQASQSTHDASFLFFCSHTYYFIPPIAIFHANQRISFGHFDGLLIKAFFRDMLIILKLHIL